jgi:hypothetical protein
MNRGYIKQWRKIKEWEWYRTPHMVHFFGHIVREANHKDGRWQGVDVKRGQIICGRKQLALDTGLSEQIVRTCIERLKSTSEITIRATNKFSIITIVKYEDYQPNEKVLTSTSTSELTNNQPTINQQITTNKNDNNGKNDKDEHIAAPAAKPPTKKTTTTKPLQEHLTGLAIYTIAKRFTFDNPAQITAHVKRYLRASQSLSGYTPEQILRAFFFAYHESKTAGYEVKLETIGKKIHEHKDWEVPFNYQQSFRDILAEYEEHKENVLSASSYLLCQTTASN